MATTTTRFPSGGSASAAKRQSRRTDLTPKEYTRKRKRFSHSTWFTAALPCMVDALSQKLFEEYVRQNARVRKTCELDDLLYEAVFFKSYRDRKEFCTEYADLVVDARKVIEPADRIRDLDVVLSAAVQQGRIDIVEVRRGQVIIFLCEDEWEAQRQLAVEREKLQEEKRKERRRRNARRGHSHNARQLPIVRNA